MPAVRDAARTPYPRRAADDPFRLLVFGGSQGASVFAGLVPGALALLPKDALAKFAVTQQARPRRSRERRPTSIAGSA